jgi:hypothetical protein
VPELGNDGLGPNCAKQVKVNLGAVYGTEGENKDFTDATPSGSCWMVIKENFPASRFFKPGKKYYVTFTEARTSNSRPAPQRDLRHQFQGGPNGHV